MSMELTVRQNRVFFVKKSELYSPLKKLKFASKLIAEFFFVSKLKLKIIASLPETKTIKFICHILCVLAR